MVFPRTIQKLKQFNKVCISKQRIFQEEFPTWYIPLKAGIIRSWADNFSLHCNVFICIRHIWIKPVLCSRMVSLFHHTWPWTHKCSQSSHSAHRNGRVFRHSVQTACCYWIINRGKSSSDWNSQTNASRLWWSVWCEYSKALGKVKCVVRKWFVVISVLMWVQ